ncbi:MAG: hypothetical protein IK104_09005 [Clostridia bacterium]|nr:hypothetical protein [Clostridia bacterium]
MDVIVSGAKGKMGSTLVRLLLRTSGAHLSGGIDRNTDGSEGFNCVKSAEQAVWPADVIVDFSNRTQTREIVSFAVSRRLPLVIGTTGQTPEDMVEIRKAAEIISILMTANFAVCYPLIRSVVAETVGALEACEVTITEIHGVHKKDSPSGTAKAFASDILSGNANIPVEIISKREADVKGIHEITVKGADEKLTIIHEIISRDSFAHGALEAAKRLTGRSPGLYTE